MPDIGKALRGLGIAAALLAALPSSADAAFMFRHYKGGATGPTVASVGGSCAVAGLAYRGQAFASTATGGYSSVWTLTGAPAFVSIANSGGAGTLNVAGVPSDIAGVQSVTFTVTESLYPPGFGEIIYRTQTITMRVASSIEAMRAGLGDSFGATCAPMTA